MMPSLFTPVNSIEILRDCRLVLLVWYLDELTGQYIVVGQLNINLNNFTTHEDSYL